MQPLRPAGAADACMDTHYAGAGRESERRIRAVRPVTRLDGKRRSSPLPRSCGHETAHQHVRLDIEGIAQGEDADQGRLPAAALEQGHERLIEPAVERELGLRESAFLTEILEEASELDAEPIAVIHGAQAWRLREPPPKTIVFVERSRGGSIAMSAWRVGSRGFSPTQLHDELLELCLELLRASQAESANIMPRDARRLVR